MSLTPFLHRLKADLNPLFLGIMLLLATACQHTPGEVDLPLNDASQEMINTVLHVGGKQDSSGTYQNLGNDGKVSIRISKDHSQLMLRYNVPLSEDVILRLYDQEGQLKHMERVPRIEAGLEQSLDLSQLDAGAYNLQINLEDGVELSQQISLHNRAQL